MDGKLKLEYYKLQKTIEEEIRLENVDGQYVPATGMSAQGNHQKSTLDEILEKINEKYKGEFNDSDRVMLDALHDKLIADKKLESSARTSDPSIFHLPCCIWNCCNRTALWNLRRVILPSLRISQNTRLS